MLMELQPRPDISALHSRVDTRREDPFDTCRCPHPSESTVDDGVPKRPGDAFAARGDPNPAVSEV